MFACMQDSIQGTKEETVAFVVGDRVKNINPECIHYGSRGTVTGVSYLPNEMGKVVTYEASNTGDNWTIGQPITKTEVQLEHDNPNLASENEYKEDFIQMNIGSLNAIASKSQEIINALGQKNVKENLTEAWLQGKIAITEDYMKTIHDFVMYNPSDDDTTEGADRPGLWENIRRKKEREGKNYRPAKPGDPDRPTKDALKKSQTPSEDKKKKKK
jgi:hypothetical protein